MANKTEKAKTLMAFVYEKSGRVVSEFKMTECLEKYSARDICEAFIEYVEKFDSFEMSSAVKAFFYKGGIDAVILARKRRVDRENKKKKFQQSIVEAGVRAAQLAEEERVKKLKEDTVDSGKL